MDSSARRVAAIRSPCPGPTATATWPPLEILWSASSEARPATAPAPTSTASGVPTRLVFGLEEVWESRLSGQAQDGPRESVNPASFRVIGPYFADDTCAFLDNPLPVCATQQTRSGLLTTHPDQQSGIWVPQDDGGVTLVIGNDGGTYTQTVAKGGQLNKNWGRGNQAGYNANTLLPYDASAAKDGTVTYGLQDNGSGVVRPDGKGWYTLVSDDGPEGRA
ncbi:MAG: hypothetical protein KY433_01475 [Actinobacteria bacterium]|nr:hypothetical protein [Actinomycetota bacterium]